MQKKKISKAQSKNIAPPNDVKLTQKTTEKRANPDQVTQPSFVDSDAKISTGTIVWAKMVGFFFHIIIIAFRK